jgi:localization factor PodJL
LALLILGAAYSHLEDGDLAKGQGHAQTGPAPAQPLDASYATPGVADTPQIAAAGAKPPTGTLAAEVFSQAIHGPNLAGGAPPLALFSNQPMAGADKIPAAALQPAAQPLALSAHEDTTNAAGLSREFLNLKAQAEAGNPAAQYAIALRYASGEGVTRDYKQALEFFGKAANQGLAPAQFRLASIYEKGLGTEPNAKIAALWYQRAAQTGNVHAMHNLGVLLAEGLDGRPDYAKAAFWFAQAAAYGEGDSQFNLAVLLGRGLGVTQDLTKSYAWFAVAAALGDAEAAKRRDETGARLSMSEIQTAKKFVQAYLARPRDPIANNVDSPPPGFASKIPVVAKNSDL